MSVLIIDLKKMSEKILNLPNNIKKKLLTKFFQLSFLTFLLIKFCNKLQMIGNSDRQV